MNKRVIRAPYAHVAQLIYDTPLMVTPQRLRVILDALTTRMGLADMGEASLSVDDFARPRSGSDMLVAARESIDGDYDPHSRGYVVLKGGAALIQVSGTLTNRASWLDATSGLTSYERVRQALVNAMEDVHVKRVVMEVDSPGGTASGVFDLADLIYKMRGTKHITAVVNDLAASAAYAIASAANEVWATRTSLTGSIGVIATHFDYSGMTKQMGVKVTHVFAGARKADLSPYFPLSEQASGWLQNSVDLVYDMFTKSVARNRNIKVKRVIEQEAGMFTGEEGVEQGLVDSVMSIDEAVDRIISRRAPHSSVSAKQSGGAGMSMAKSQDRRGAEEEDREEEEEETKTKSKKARSKAEEEEEEEEEEPKTKKARSKKARSKAEEEDREEEEEEEEKPEAKKASAFSASSTRKRAEDISALCDAAGRMDMAMELFLSGMSAEQARVALQTAQASGQSSTDSNISPRTVRGGPKKEARVDTHDIYNRYNQSMTAEVK